MLRLMKTFGKKFVSLSSLHKVYYKLIGTFNVLSDSPAYENFCHHENFCQLIACNRKSGFSDNLQQDISLDLGCGPNPKNPFCADVLYGIDIVVPNINSNCLIKQANLSLESIPFPDNNFDYITAHDFIEHVPRILAVSNPASGIKTIFPFVNLMSDIYRVLKPDGFFLSVTPAFPFSVSFCDPTHVNFINEHTFKNYFSGNNAASAYGFSGNFRLVKQGFRGKYLISMMQAIK